VLIVEDDRATARLLEFTLERAGYQVELAGDGGAALERLYDFEPDAVILDLHLPHTSGLEILDRIRSDPQLEGIVVIVLSATAYEERSETLFQADAVEAKPLAPSSLLRRLASLRLPPVLTRIGMSAGRIHV
jgi:CheY-like chemotaxis protein